MKLRANFGVQGWMKHIGLLLSAFAVLSCGLSPKAPAGPHLPYAADAHVLGTDGPLVVDAMAEDGSWVLLCQAREDTDGDGMVEVHVGFHGDTYGDELASYLIIGEGAGERVQDLIATDEVGGHLVVVRDDRMWLEHPATGTRVDLTALGADLTDDGSELLPHRAAGFDASGTQLVYIRDRDDKQVVVVRNLASGAEVEVDPGDGNLWRTRLDPHGEWVELWVIAKDTNGDGELTWPSVRTSLSDRRCRGPISSYSTSGLEGDEPLMRIARVVGSTPLEIPSTISPLGSSLLVRGTNGELVMIETDGTREVLVPAECGAMVTNIDIATSQLVVACTRSQPAELRIYRGHNVTSLGAIRESPEEDDLDDLGRHVLGYGEDLGTIIIDVHTGQRRMVEGWQRVLARSGDNTLVNRAGEFVLLTGPDERTLAKVSDYASAYRAGAFVAVGQIVVNVDTGDILGKFKGKALGVNTRGDILVSQGKPRELNSGPLRWVTPR
jgi:hypothetical protein